MELFCNDNAQWTICKIDQIEFLHLRWKAFRGRVSEKKTSMDWTLYLEKVGRGSQSDLPSYYKCWGDRQSQVTSCLIECDKTVHRSEMWPRLAAHWFFSQSSPRNFVLCWRPTTRSEQHLQKIHLYIRYSQIQMRRIVVWLIRIELGNDRNGAAIIS